MKVKMLKFKDGKVAFSRGLLVEVNKQKPILEEEKDFGEQELKKIRENPKKFKFSKKAKKL